MFACKIARMLSHSTSYNRTTNRMQLKTMELKIQSDKENQKLFKSTIIRNADVWQRIAEDVEDMTAMQCESKFKHLKQFIQKKDNIGNKSSGAHAISFEYFDEFEDIFRLDPNIKPVSTASSSRQTVESNTVITGENSGTILSPETVGIPPAPTTVGQVEVGSTRPQRRKRTRLEIQLEKFDVTMERRQEACDRHLERFMLHQEAQGRIFSNLVQKLIDKL